MKITKFEDLECWQEARKLVNGVYRVCRVIELRKDFSLSDQMKRAAVPVSRFPLHVSRFPAFGLPSPVPGQPFSPFALCPFALSRFSRPYRPDRPDIRFFYPFPIMV